jgi:predicted transcriptional regulator
MTKSKAPLAHLSRRERQIMEIVYRRGEATAAEVQKDLPSPPSYSAVRAALSVLEEKGHLSHRYEGPSYVYSPTADRKAVRESMLKQLLHTFFEGSREQLVASLLDSSESKPSEGELDRISALIKQAKKEGR